MNFSLHYCTICEIPSYIGGGGERNSQTLITHLKKNHPKLSFFMNVDIQSRTMRIKKDFNSYMV